MAVDRTPVLKRCRSLGMEPMYLGIDKKSNRRPNRSNRKQSEYGLQLREKQKARFSYGVLEKQFRRYYEEANRLQGKTGDNLLAILETRLDNVVYRAGLGRTRRQARQFVVHGHFTVNGRKVDIPSYRVGPHDIVDLVEKVREQTPHIVNRETHNERSVPAWMQVVPDRGRILVHSVPTRQQIVIDVQEQLIVELYSK